MKMTKEIREYIKDRIAQKAQESNALLELQQACDEERAAWEAELEKIKLEANEKLKDLAQKFNYSYPRYGYSGSQDLIPVCAFHNYDSSGLPAWKAYQEGKQQREKLVEKKIRDICVEIQLGGNAEDLRAMIDEVTF